MARIRTIKPEFFKNFALFQAEQASKLPLRLCFSGLWTSADREGRFKWIPEELKIDIIPYDKIDFNLVLDALEKYEYIVKYEKNGKFYGYIPSWHEHQSINNKERDSILPDPQESKIVTRASRVDDAKSTRISKGQGERKGKERKGKEQRVDDATLIFPFNSENFKKIWQTWKDYKKIEHKFEYKSIISEQTALNKLDELARGLEIAAIKIIEQSIANGWEGLFELKKTTPDKSREPPDEEKPKIYPGNIRERYMTGKPGTIKEVIKNQRQTS